MHTPDPADVREFFDRSKEIEKGIAQIKELPFALVESQLRPEGAYYTRLRTYPLVAGANES